MKFSCITIILILFTSCKKDPALIKIENLNGNVISILGHGGMGSGFKFPMNSDESLNTCLSLACDGTECDIQISADSVLIIYHDNDLSEKTPCTGLICEQKWPDFWGCHYASPFSSRLNILSLKGWFNSIQKSRAKPVITLDCKLRNGNLNYEVYREKFARAVIKFINENCEYKYVNIESSDIKFLEILRNLNPSARTFFYTADIRDALKFSGILTGVTMNNDLVSASDIKILHAKNLQVALFGMYRQKDNVTALEKSPDFVQCDKIIEMLQIFDRFKN